MYYMRPVVGGEAAVGYSFKDYLRDRGEFLEDDEVFGRAPLTERVFREFKLGIFTMFVITLLLVTLFWDNRRMQEPYRPDGRPAPAEQPASDGVLARIMSVFFPKEPAGELPQPDEDAPAAADANRPPPPPPVPVRLNVIYKRYTARSGDTLYSISRKVYGDGSKWKLILKANPDLGAPENLTAGMKLRIPVKASSASRPG